jgi:hypothetical protein
VHAADSGEREGIAALSILLAAYESARSKTVAPVRTSARDDDDMVTSTADLAAG